MTSFVEILVERRFSAYLLRPKSSKSSIFWLTGRKKTIEEYLKKFPNRDEVKYFAMDMNHIYLSSCKEFFPNAKPVADCLRYTRCCTGAAEVLPQT